MRLADFVQLRPTLYHLTAHVNLARIQRLATLEPATTLLEAAGCSHRRQTQRFGTLVVTVDGERVCLGDQDPLKQNNCKLEDEFSFEQLLQLLNEHVFFWPGTMEKPVPSGCNFLAHYAAHDGTIEDWVVLKFPTSAIFEANPSLAPRFCKFNSGAPRSNPSTGKPPRGPDLFLPAQAFPATPGKVVEVVFKGSVTLPLDAMTVTSPTTHLS